MCISDSEATVKNVTHSMYNTLHTCLSGIKNEYFPTDSLPPFIENK